MSFATALAYGFGGYGQGRQRRFQDTLEQQQLTNEQQQYAEQNRRADQELAIQTATAKAQADAELRQRGINPATATWNPTTMQYEGGKPFAPLAVEQRVVPGKVGTNYQVTPQDLIKHYTDLASAYAEEGRTDKANIAANYANAIQAEILRAQTEQATLNREIYMAGLNNANITGRMDKSEAATAQNQERSQEAATTRQQTHEDYTAWQGDVNQARRDYSTATRKVESVRSTLTSTLGKLNGTNKPAVTDKNGNVTPAVTKNPNMGQYENTLRAITEKAISGQGGPGYIDQMIDKFSKNPALSEDQKDDAIDYLSNLEDAIKEAQEAHESLQDTEKQRPRNYSGGSPGGSGNPTSGGEKLPQRTIWDMLMENGATPQEATTLTAVAYAESGGNPGDVNPNDNGGKQTSWGLFQISDGTHNEPAGWDDPETNTRMAIAKLRSRQGLHAWGTYNTGAYKKYLPQEQVASQ
jgi:hypothetical protein